MFYQRPQNKYIKLIKISIIYINSLNISVRYSGFAWMTICLSNCRTNQICRPTHCGLRLTPNLYCLYCPIRICFRQFLSKLMNREQNNGRKVIFIAIVFRFPQIIYISFIANIFFRHPFDAEFSVKHNQIFCAFRCKCDAFYVLFMTATKLPKKFSLVLVSIESVNSDGVWWPPIRPSASNPCLFSPFLSLSARSQHFITVFFLLRTHFLLQRRSMQIFFASEMEKQWPKRAIIGQRPTVDPLVIRVWSATVGRQFATDFAKCGLGWTQSNISINTTSTLLYYVFRVLCELMLWNEIVLWFDWIDEFITTRLGDDWWLWICLSCDPLSQTLDNNRSKAWVCIPFEWRFTHILLLLLLLLLVQHLPRCKRSDRNLN